MIDRVCLLAWLAVGLAALGSCGDDVRTPTQIQLSVDAEEGVKEMLSALRFSSRRADSTEDASLQTATYLKADLVWPTELYIVPANDKDLPPVVEFWVDALDSAGKSLVQFRAYTSFVKGAKQEHNVLLARCGTKKLGELCSDADCRGTSCLTCVGDLCAPVPHLDTAPPDAGPADAGADGGPLADAGADAGADAARDAAPDHDGDVLAADASDGRVPDDLDASPGPSDGSRDADVVDRYMPVDAPDAYVPPLDCTANASWSLHTSDGLVPANAVLAGQQVVKEKVYNQETAYNQYVCRSPAGIPGKVNAFSDPASNGPERFLGSCWNASYDGTNWSAQPADAAPDFQLLTAPAECLLSWASASGALPTGAKVTGHDEHGQPLYSCRASFDDSDSRGYATGRVSATADVCHVHYFGAVVAKTSFDVLVQLAPL